jgi:hypothetical protein
MVRLLIRLQTSKQWYQSGSKNAATVYHRLPNERTLDMITLHGATKAPQRMAPGSKKKGPQATKCAFILFLTVSKTKMRAQKMDRPGERTPL